LGNEEGVVGELDRPIKKSGGKACFGGGEDVIVPPSGCRGGEEESNATGGRGVAHRDGRKGEFASLFWKEKRKKIYLADF